MNIQLHYYDIYPKVFIENEPVKITVKPLGWHVAFGENTRVVMQPRNDRNYPTPTDNRPPVARELTLSPDADGCLRFTFTFTGEQPWSVLIFDGGADSPRTMLTVYSLREDMRSRYPYLGDLHVHSSCSDGHEAPEIIAANLRKHGYDFTVISDHERYYGSLMAIRAYENVKMDMTILPGEECHLPDVCMHLLSVGALWAVHGQVESCKAAKEKGGDPYWRAVDGKSCPPVISDEEFRRQVMEIADRIGALPENIDPFTYAACIWVWDHIRAADGLAVFPHPFWIVRNVLSVPEGMTEYLFQTKPFDAFELIGGERYLDKNEFQVYKYGNLRLQGMDSPVIGSSDSHGSTECNPDWNLGQTIIFARKNERRELLDSIRRKYTVTVENISPEYRLAGDFRFVQFGRFLKDYYFPLHDELCFEEGRLMKAYICGEPGAKDALERLQGRTGKLLEKYFAY